MLNGFGDAARIEALGAGLAKEFGGKVGFCDADISKPEQIRAMVEQATKESDRRHQPLETPAVRRFEYRDGVPPPARRFPLFVAVPRNALAECLAERKPLNAG